MLCAISADAQVCRSVLKADPLTNEEVAKLGVEKREVEGCLWRRRFRPDRRWSLEGFVGTVEEVDRERTASVLQSVCSAVKRRWSWSSTRRKMEYGTRRGPGRRFSSSSASTLICGQPLIMRDEVPWE